MIQRSNFRFFRETILSILILSSSPIKAGTISILYNDSITTDNELSIDGPYIIQNNNETLRCICVDSKHKINDSTYLNIPKNFSFKVTDHENKNSFMVKLHNVKRPKYNYKKPSKLFVMSDPHGRFDCFISLLKGNGVINNNLNWSFGKNHLMIIGDVFDRGNDVLPIFWLIYKLEEEAYQKGGHVSFLLGNHEPMVLMNDMRYSKGKYKKLADSLHIDYPMLFSPNSILGQWLLTRNTIQTIGNKLFVHAGLSKELLEKKISITEINEQISEGLYKTKAQRKQLSSMIYFLHGSNGPLWYRGMVRTEKKYNPLKEDDLKKILKKYGVKQIIVGHTIFDDITTMYDGKVTTVNVDNEENMIKGNGRAILIMKNKTYVVGDKGILHKLN